MSETPAQQYRDERNGARQSTANEQCLSVSALATPHLRNSYSYQTRTHD
jgi:hypothetical protein